MSSKKRNHAEEEIKNEEDVAGSVSKSTEETNSESQSETAETGIQNDGGNEGTGNGESEDQGEKLTDKLDVDVDIDLEKHEESGEEEAEEFKGKTYSEAFENKEGNPRRHSWPEGQKVEFFETVAYLSYPPDGARKDLYTPTEEDIKATDWE